ncbi:MAG: radical SAM family heme chaperone HemW [Chloroflexi bacterium]|nr:radical SAM family heme chaperone HemW [Chloroflexota bacterium]
MEEPYSIYLHFPFCKRRCNYCDFNTYAGVLNRLPRYIDALCLEIQTVAHSHKEYISVHSVYLGGGTPSLIPADELKKVLACLKANFQFTHDTEVTLEANPGTLSPDYLKEIRRMGINRLSIGMQSGSNQELKILGRIHLVEDVHQSVAWARTAGFDNLSLDLIYGLPGQTLDQWRHNLHAALDLYAEHLSLYALTLESNVPMFRQIQNGELPAQDDDLMADMYELATDELNQAGFEQYEISNWVRIDPSGRDLRSRHNLQYWLNLPYLGFGAGAHGSAEGVRTENLSRIKAYSERCFLGNTGEFPRGPALKTAVTIDKHREMQETMLLGLRLRQGVSASRFYARFGEEMHSIFGKEIEELIHLQLLEENRGGTDALRLTRHARFLSNVVFRQFVD